MMRTGRMIMAFVLAVMMVLNVSVCTAEQGRRVDTSDYAYIRGDYRGIDQAAKSVFYVEMYQSDSTFIGSGSGFVMFDEGLFITNQHVIEGTSYLLIMDDDGRQYLLDQVLVSDQEHDIAILYFPQGKDYRSLPYDTAFDQLVRGQPVLTIGSPKGLPGTVADGIISAFPKFQGEDTRYIQITAPISHGSSGGCLLNENLQVIGVTSSGVDEGQNLGFAIPVFIVEQLYRQWNKRDTVPLGTKRAWDTVGAGLHSRISGAVGRPRAPEGTAAQNTPARETGGRIVCRTGDTIQVVFSLAQGGEQPDGVMGRLSYDPDIFTPIPSGELIGADGINILNRRPVVLSFLVSKYAPAGQYDIGAEVIEAADADGQKYTDVHISPVRVTVESTAAVSGGETPAPAPAPTHTANRKIQVAVGDYVTFGHYPQTASGNDQTPIEWLVLDIIGNQALLLSRYGLDAVPYNSASGDITWEQCTLRQWLNRDFLNKAFSTAEQQAIAATQVSSGSYQGYYQDVSNGSDTRDKVFLLSYFEANRYLKVQHFSIKESKNNIKSRTAPTAYAVRQGAYVNPNFMTAEGTNPGKWWLRSPGSGQRLAGFVDCDGCFNGIGVYHTTHMVRPAVWINLEAVTGVTGSSTAGERESGSQPAVGTGNGGTSGSSKKQIKAGDYVTFGHYPQTASGKDQTPIVWLVLEVRGNQAFLLSKYGLDHVKETYDHQTDPKYLPVLTWEDCKIRKWLNSDFLKKAFTAGEQKAILTTTVDNSKKQGYSGFERSGGKNTKDKLFLLSYAEANKYLGVTTSKSPAAARVAPTAYAVKQGAYAYDSYKTDDGENTAIWILRSPSHSKFKLARLYMSGSLDTESIATMSWDTYSVVRPAMWINLDAVSY